MIKQLLIDLQHYPKEFLMGVQNGNEFENQIEDYLFKNIGLQKIIKTQINDLDKLQEIVKNVIPKKNGLLINTEWQHLDNCYISQPFGTQSYPDFIIFSHSYIIILEIKFTATNNGPMWNSGFPRKNGIYIYGNTNKQDITFFMGKDVLTDIERELMLNFFQELKEVESQFNQELSKHDLYNSGFQVYIRKAFMQKNTQNSTEMSFLENSNREIRENNVLDFFN